MITTTGPKTESLSPFWGCTMSFPDSTVSLVDKGFTNGIDPSSGLPIIGRTTPINGGVWMNDGEVLVINDEDEFESDHYNRIFSSVSVELERINRSINGKLPLMSALQVVAAAVRANIPLNTHRAERASYYMHGSPVGLSYFIGEDRGGVCRHQAALGGYICERLASVGALDVQVNLNRNRLGGPRAVGHAWVRSMSNATGNCYILDTTHEVVGVIDEIGDSHWPYKQPEDPAVYTN